MRYGGIQQDTADTARYGIQLDAYGYSWIQWDIERDAVDLLVSSASYRVLEV